MTAAERELALAVEEAKGRDVREGRLLHSLISLLEAIEGIEDGKPDEHRHLCPNKACGTVWHHDRNTLIGKGDEYYDRAHTCPKCGTKTIMKYRGPKQATCYYDGVTLTEEAA